MEQFVSKYKDLTKSEQQAFSYLYEHEALVIDMTVQMVAKNSLCSKTVIINLCKKLGFDGFSEFKYYLKNTKKNETIQIPLDQQEYLIIENVKKTMALCNLDSLKKAAHEIAEAKTVYLVARGTSKAAAIYLEHLLLLLGIPCINLQDYNLATTAVKKINMNEVIVIISLSGETRKALEVADIAKARKAGIISLTGFSTNSLSKIARYNLFCAADSLKTVSDDLNSRIGMFAVIDMLVPAIQEYFSQTIFKSSPIISSNL